MCRTTLYTIIQMRLPEIVSPQTRDLAADVMLGRDIAPAVEAGLYARTGAIGAEGLEDLFEMGQSAINPDCPLPRSLSVGDIAVAEATAWLCAPEGWTEISGELGRSLLTISSERREAA